MLQNVKNGLKKACFTCSKLISVTFTTYCLFLVFFCFVFDLGILKCAKHDPYLYKHCGQLYHQAGCPWI